MQTQSPILPVENRHAGHLSPIHHPWIDFNRQLSRDAVRFLPNERFIEERLDALMEMESGDLRIFWLTFSRIAELALKQAGDYADNCEFQAAGDLLVNPRRIDVYRRGYMMPVVKDRHRCLSDQFTAAIGDENPVAWLIRETLPHIREQALLPHMKQMLSASGFMTPAYVEDLNRRMCRVTDTIAFLMSWQIADSADLFMRIQNSGPETGISIRSHLCLFDHESFHELGEDIEDMVLNGECLTRFLVEGPR